MILDFNGHSMVGELRRVAVCPPRKAGWDLAEHKARWRHLGFHHEANFEVAQSQHDAMCGELAKAGAEVICLPAAPELTLDAVYAHDASFATDLGLILMRPG